MMTFVFDFSIVDIPPFQSKVVFLMMDSPLAMKRRGLITHPCFTFGHVERANKITFNFDPYGIVFIYISRGL